MEVTGSGRPSCAHPALMSADAGRRPPHSARVTKKKLSGKRALVVLTLKLFTVTVSSEMHSDHFCVAQKYLYDELSYKYLYRWLRCLQVGCQVHFVLLHTAALQTAVKHVVTEFPLRSSTSELGRIDSFIIVTFIIVS